MTLLARWLAAPPADVGPLSSRSQPANVNHISLCLSSRLLFRDFAVSRIRHALTDYFTPKQYTFDINDYRMKWILY